MTDLDQNDGKQGAPLGDGGKKPGPVDLSAPYRGVDMTSGRKKSSLPGVLCLVAGAACGYFLGGNVMGMLPMDSAAPAQVVATDVPPAETAAVDAAVAAPDAATTSESSVTDVTAAVTTAAPVPTDTAVPGVTDPSAPVSTTDSLAPVTPDASAPTPVTDAAMATPPEDLPMPQNAIVAPEPGAAPATNTATAPAATPVTSAAPATTPAGQTPSAAEMAIVQNAAVLDQLSQPNGAPIAQTNAAPVPVMPAGEAQDAIVRPLPKQYLIVKKNHDAEDVDSRLTAGRQALVQNRNSAALELFNELYKDFPRDRRVLMGRAVALQKLGDYSTALSAYEEVLTVEPQNLEALTNMLGLLKMQDPALAVQKLSELQEAYPYNADIAAQLAIAHAGQGSYQEAQRFLDMADALKPGSAFVLYNKAVLYDKMGRKAEAADLYRRIVRMHAEGQLDQQMPIESIKNRLSTMR